MHECATDSERFELAVNFVLKHEGGYVNNPKDPGGATNYGVSLSFIKSMGIDVNLDGYIDAKDIEGLTKDNAKEIYKQYFWDPNNYCHINDIVLGSKFFDMCVNLGSVRANKIVQKCINILYSGALVVDGVLGPISLSYINKAASEGFSPELMIEVQKGCAMFYELLVDMHPDLIIFLKGWLARSYDEVS